MPSQEGIHFFHFEKIPTLPGMIRMEQFNFRQPHNYRNYALPGHKPDATF